MVTVAGHVPGFAADVAELLPLLFGLLAIPGNMATPVAVVARCSGKEQRNELLSQEKVICKHIVNLRYYTVVYH